jgi:RNA polymerase sigma-70 factor (ECF subfamily)
MSIGNRRVGPDMNEVVAATDRELWTAAVDGDAEAFGAQSGSVLPWLLGVAANQLRNQRRSGRRASAALGRLNAREVTPDHSDETVGRIADEAQMAEVQAVVEQLPEHERDVLALCAWAGLDYEEAAIALAVPVGTVRSRLSRARGHLRELVDADGHELKRDVVAT